jgi:hypothetical protein
MPFTRSVWRWNSVERPQSASGSNGLLARYWKLVVLSFWKSTSV